MYGEGGAEVTDADTCLDGDAFGGCVNGDDVVELVEVEHDAVCQADGSP